MYKFGEWYAVAPPLSYCSLPIDDDMKRYQYISNTHHHINIIILNSCLGRLYALVVIVVVAHNSSIIQKQDNIFLTTTYSSIFFRCVFHKYFYFISSIYPWYQAPLMNVFSILFSSLFFSCTPFYMNVPL